MVLTDFVRAFRDNMRCLPSQPVRRRYPHGESTDTEGLWLGEWALHECEGDKWACTHLKSGLASPACATPIEALITLGILLGSGYNFDVLDETYDPANPPAIEKDIQQRITGARTRLDGWDLDIDYNEPECEQ